MFTCTASGTGKGFLLGLMATLCVTATAGNVALAQSPGFACIGNLVWEDLDWDGRQDPGEPGIPGVVLTLCDDAGNELDTRVTDANGRYYFTRLGPGDYIVKLDESTLPPQMTSTIPFRGNPARDNNPGPVPVTLDSPGERDFTIDFGYVVCSSCAGGVTEMTLQYCGTEPAYIQVIGNNKEVIYSGLQRPGMLFHITGNKVDGTFGREIKVSVNCVETTEIHTSCSEPIASGQVFGVFKVLGAASRDGGVICAPVSGAPGGGDICEGGKLRAVSMRYTAQPCSATSHSQDPGKVNCLEPMSLGIDDVFIVASDKDHPDNRNALIWFSGVVSLGDIITFDALAGGQTRLKGEMHVFIFSDDIEMDLLQQLEFHTSCSEPLFIGDQFGSLELVDFIPAP